MPYDFEDACAEAPDVCLGVPYFNWGPSYLEIASSVIDGTFAAEWQWLGPDWARHQQPRHDGHRLVQRATGSSADAAADARRRSSPVSASGEIDLWVGPLNYQDGSAWLADGEKATDFQIWYTEQLLEGIEGASAAE